MSEQMPERVWIYTGELSMWTDLEEESTDEDVMYIRADLAAEPVGLSEMFRRVVREHAADRAPLEVERQFAEDVYTYLLAAEQGEVSEAVHMEIRDRAERLRFGNGSAPCPPPEVERLREPVDCYESYRGFSCEQGAGHDGGHSAWVEGFGYIRWEG